MPKGAEIGTYTTTFVYQGPFKKDSSTGSPVINEVVLGTRVNKGEMRHFLILVTSRVQRSKDKERARS